MNPQIEAICHTVSVDSKKVGIWAWGDFSWLSCFSRLGGWATVIFQLSGSSVSCYDPNMAYGLKALARVGSERLYQHLDNS